MNTLHIIYIYIYIDTCIIINIYRLRTNLNQCLGSLTYLLENDLFFSAMSLAKRLILSKNPCSLHDMGTFKASSRAFPEETLRESCLFAWQFWGPDVGCFSQHQSGKRLVFFDGNHAIHPNCVILSHKPASNCGAPHLWLAFHLP